MRKYATAILVGIAMFVLVIWVSRPAAAQGQAASAESPRTADGHPDLNGLWNDAPSGNLNPADREFEKASDGSILFDFSTAPDQVGNCVDASCQLPNQAPYKPEYIERVKGIGKTFNGNSTDSDPEMQCKPYGIPRGGVGGAMQFVQTPKVIAILYEGHPQPSSVYRIIYMDSPHPTDLDPTYLGDSRGHWEGDTLVVDVTGLNDETWLSSGMRNKFSTIHSAKEHVVERWTRKGDVITYEATVDDPVMFTRSWVTTPRRIYKDKVEGDQLLELFCTPEAAGLGHFIKPNDAEQGTFCHMLGKDDYDRCLEDAKKKAAQKATQNSQ